MFHNEDATLSGSGWSNTDRECTVELKDSDPNFDIAAQALVYSASSPTMKSPAPQKGILYALLGYRHYFVDYELMGCYERAVPSSIGISYNLNKACPQFVTLRFDKPEEKRHGIFIPCCAEWQHKGA